MTPVPECDGRCCAVFYLPLAREEMTPARMADVQDGHRIFAMTRPLGLDEAAGRAEAHGLSLPAIMGRTDGDRGRADGHLYACLLWDDRTRRCVQYDARPRMCSGYPYGKPCVHCGGVDAKGPSVV